MAALLYTDSDKVLNAVGLTADDIDPNFFTLSDRAREVSVDLFGWVPTHAAVFKADADTATDAERYQSDCLVLYCTYFCAARVATAAMAVMQSRTDGTNAYSRISGLDLADVEAKMLARAEGYKQSLLTALADTSVAPRVAQASFVGLGTDPVTG